MSDQNKLIQILFEEFSSNGGHFSSPDSDFWFQQSFGEFGESNQEILNRFYFELRDKWQIWLVFPSNRVLSLDKK